MTNECNGFNMKWDSAGVSTGICTPLEDQGRETVGLVADMQYSIFCKYFRGISVCYVLSVT